MVSPKRFMTHVGLTINLASLEHEPIAQMHFKYHQESLGYSNLASVLLNICSNNSLSHSIPQPRLTSTYFHQQPLLYCVKILDNTQIVIK